MIIAGMVFMPWYEYWFFVFTKFWDIFYPGLFVGIIILVLLLRLYLVFRKAGAQGVAVFISEKSDSIWKSLIDVPFKFGAKVASLVLIIIFVVSFDTYIMQGSISDYHDLLVEDIQKFEKIVKESGDIFEEAVFEEESVEIDPIDKFRQDVALYLSGGHFAVYLNDVCGPKIIASMTPVKTSLKEDAISLGKEVLKDVKTTHKENPSWWKYGLSIVYFLFLLFVCIRQLIKDMKKTKDTKKTKERYMKAGIIFFVGLLIATMFSSWYLPADILERVPGAWSLILGLAVLIHGAWRYKVVNVELESNTDPEAEEGKKGPQKNYYFIWSAILFHAFLFLLVGPFSGILYLLEIPIFLDLLMVIALVLFFISKTSKSATLQEKIKKSYIYESLSKQVISYCARFIKFGKEHIEVKISEDDPGEIKEVTTFKGLGKQAFVILVASILLYFLYHLLFFVKATSFLTVLILLPFTYLLGCSLEIHIRQILVPAIGKELIYHPFWLLGKKYLSSGFHIILLTGWLWRLKFISIPHVNWEIDGIQTKKIPTKDKDSDAAGVKGDAADAGVTVDLNARALTKCTRPEGWFEMSDEDRGSETRIKEVLKRIFEDTIRSVVQKLTYNQVKTEDWLEFPVRRDDLEFYKAINPNHPMIAMYHKRAIMHIKVKSVTKSENVIFDDGTDDGIRGDNLIEYNSEYVGDNKKGVMIPATYAEYADWKMVVSTGCSLIEFGVTDVSSEIVETAETAIAVARRKLKQMKIDKLTMKEEGEGLGDKDAAQIDRFLKMLLKEEYKNDPDTAKFALDGLVRILGARTLGTLFDGIEGVGGIAQKISNILSNDN